MNKPAEVAVTQADRNAAIRLLEAGGQDWQAKEIRIGQGDHFPLTQAFARHRTTNHQALVEALREAIAAIEDDTGLDEAICCSGHDCGCRASTHRDLLLHNLRAALSEVSHG